VLRDVRILVSLLERDESQDSYWRCSDFGLRLIISCRLFESRSIPIRLACHNDPKEDELDVSESRIYVRN
jgi:hypothetical protein